MYLVIIVPPTDEPEDPLDPVKELVDAIEAIFAWRDEPVRVEVVGSE